MKVIIIGASTSGKTTIVKRLKDEFPKLPVQEADDFLTSLNSGTYPRDIKQKMEVLSPVMVKQVLDSKSIIFFTNTHYFRNEDLIKAKNLGFKIILLKLDKDVMLERNQKRFLTEGYEDLTQYCDSMLLYQKDIIDTDLFDAIIDVNHPIENILSRLQPILADKS